LGSVQIALSEQFQVLKDYPSGTSILDFIALETEDIVAYMKNMSENITAMIEQKASTPDADGIIHFDFTDVTKAAVNSTMAALHNDNFFLFLVNCCFLQYVTELFVYNFYPFIALEHFIKILGDVFYYDEDTGCEYQCPVCLEGVDKGYDTQDDKDSCAYYHKEPVFLLEMKKVDRILQLGDTCNNDHKADDKAYK